MALAGRWSCTAAHEASSPASRRCLPLSSHSCPPSDRQTPSVRKLRWSEADLYQFSASIWPCSIRAPTIADPRCSRSAQQEDCMLHVPAIGCAVSSAPTLTSSCILQAFIVSGSSMDVPAQGMDYCNSSIHWCRLQARSSCSRAEGLVFIGGSVPRCLPRPKPPRGRRQLPPRSGTAASCTGSPGCCHAAHPPACAPAPTGSPAE